MKTLAGKRIGKAQLPQKICASCARPFAWRKKWARDWTHVRYCSRRCRGNASLTTEGTTQVAARKSRAAVT